MKSTSIFKGRGSGYDEPNATLYSLTNPIDCSDLLDVLDPFSCFDLDHDRDVFVGRLEILCSADPPHALGERTAEATPAFWWEAAVENDFFRLCGIGDL